MKVHVAITREPIHPLQLPAVAAGGMIGAWVEFTGIVRAEETGLAITALDYEAYEGMALRMMREILESLGKKHGCSLAHVIHRAGHVPVGQAAIWVGVGAPHRREAFLLAVEFMDRLKQDVPIWKRPASAGAEPKAPLP